MITLGGLYMKKTLSVFLLTALGAFNLPAAVIDLYTVLGPEVLGATGNGSATFTFDTTAQTLSIDTSWTGLSGTTTIAHIHCCTTLPGTGTVGVAVTPGTLPSFPVGVQAGSYSVTLDLTLPGTYTGSFRGMDTPAQASARLLEGILAGTAYLNIHTSTFGGGEIRGFLQPVPEPATFAFAGIALTGLFITRRYRSR